MKVLIRLLLLIVLVELCVGGYWLATRPKTVVATIPNLDGFPKWTREKLTEAVESVDPTNSADWNRLGEQFIATGFYREAEASYRQASVLSPDDPTIRFNLAFCLAAIGRPTESDGEFHRAISTGYSDPDACWYFIGRNAQSERRLDDARDAFSRATVHAVSRLEIANIDFETGKESHLQAYQRLFRANPQAWEACQALAKVMARKGDGPGFHEFSAAADLVRTRLDGPWFKRAKAIQGLSMPLDIQEQARKFRELLRAKSVSTDSIREQIQSAQKLLWDPALENVLAEVELAAGNKSQQMKSLELIIERDGANASRLARLGTAQLQDGQQEAAMQTFETGINLLVGDSPKDAIAMCETMAGLVRSSDAGKANRYAGRAAFLRGLALVDRVEFDSARAAFAKSVELDATVAHAWFWLGRMQEKLGQRQPALDSYAECLKRDPLHGKAIRHQRYLQQ